MSEACWTSVFASLRVRGSRYGGGATGARASGRRASARPSRFGPFLPRGVLELMIVRAARAHARERAGGGGSIAAGRQMGHSTGGTGAATIRATDAGALPVRRRSGPQRRQLEPGEMSGESRTRRVQAQDGATPARARPSSTPTAHDDRHALTPHHSPDVDPARAPLDAHRVRRDPRRSASSCSPPRPPPSAWPPARTFSAASASAASSSPGSIARPPPSRLADELPALDTGTAVAGVGETEIEVRLRRPRTRLRDRGHGRRGLSASGAAATRSPTASIASASLRPRDGPPGDRPRVRRRRPRGRRGRASPPMSASRRARPRSCATAPRSPSARAPRGAASPRRTSLPPSAPPSTTRIRRTSGSSCRRRRCCRSSTPPRPSGRQPPRPRWPPTSS